MPQVEQQISKVPMILQKMPFWDRTVGNLLHVSEGKNGLSWMSFLRDTSVAWLPKLVVSRSIIEISESTFLEFLESGVVYFSVPLAAKGMHNFFLKQAQREYNKPLNPEWISLSVGELSKKAAEGGDKVLKEQLPRILSVKAATILGPMVAVGLGCEYLINYSRNLMTATVFHKDKFSDVVNLSKGEMKSGEESEVVKKSTQRVLATLGIMGGTLISSMMLARYGHKTPTIKLDGMKKALKGTFLSKWADRQPGTLFESTVKHFDYDAKKGGFSLASNQLRWYMAASIPAYADAARDKLEQVESVSRLAVIMGYLAFGQQALEKGMKKIMKSYRPDLYQAMMAPTGPNGEPGVMRLTDVVDKALSKSPLNGQTVAVKSGDELLNKAHELTSQLAKQDLTLRKAITAKNVLFGVPMLVGILGTGVGISLLNQFWTKYRFQQAQQGLALPPEENRLNDEQKQQLAAMQPVVSPYARPFPQVQSLPFRNPAMTASGFGGYNPVNRYSLPL
jgi:hypothetical protein